MLPLPDIATLSLCSTLASTAFALVFLVLWRGRSGEGQALYFAGSSLLYAATLVAFCFAGSLEHPLPLVAALHGCLVATDLLILAGVRHFDGQPGLRPWMAVAVLGAAATVAMPGVVPSPDIATSGVPEIIDTLVLALAMTGVGGLLTWGRWRTPSRARRLAGLALLAYLPGYALTLASIFISWPSEPVAALLALLSDQVLLGVLNLSLLALPGERAQALLREQASRDSLTGALNRAGLEAQSRPRTLTADTAVLLIDVDHFKAINDRHGHAAGDAVLVALVSHVRALLPGASDRISRWGGDEFVVVLHGTSLNGARQFAADLRSAVRESSAFGLPRWTLSLGIGMAEGGDADLRPAIARADRALYLAKGSGRDQAAA